MVINNNKILYLLCQLIRPLIYIVYNTTYKLYINSGDVMLILGGENLFTKLDPGMSLNCAPTWVLIN